MMDFYLLDAAKLPDPMADKTALTDIPGWRCDYILRYLRACDRRLSLGAWRLMEETLERHGFSAADVKIGKNGKPECEGIYFNLSHSGEMVLCAISDSPVGCDIERVTDAPMEVAEGYFSKKERRYIADARSAEEINRRFFRLWTIKESYMKMTGEGMSLSPERIEVNIGGISVARDGELQACEVINRAVDDYEISLCRKRINKK